MHSIGKIVIIGAGSLATNLATAFYKSGFQILQIINRTNENASALAVKLNANFTNKYDEIDLSADLYIIAVSDTAINDVVEKIILKDKIVVHTAGSVNMKVLSSVSENYGVFYPYTPTYRHLYYVSLECPFELIRCCYN